MLAMPETTIGLVTDVGGTWLLAHAPGETGAYLGLTGARMSAADAIFAGFADVHVPSSRLADLVARLVERGEAVSGVVARFATDPGPSQLAAQRAEIDRLFAGATVEDIRSSLLADGTERSAKIVADLAVRSPKALKLTLAAIRNARALPTLEAALQVEYRLTVRLFEDGEFPEGVRALIVDKDKSPKWQPSTLEDVGEDLISAYLAPFPADAELSF
jgi:enoyl-CoA hydratase